MISDGRVLPKFLSPKPLTYQPSAVPANRLFPKRSYRKVPRDRTSAAVSLDVSNKLPFIRLSEQQQRQQAGCNGSSAYHNSHRLVWARNDMGP